MWFTPDATASRRTATAASGSLGGPHTPGPASCIAPYPIRLTVSDVPGKVKRPPSLDSFIVCSFADSLLRKLCCDHERGTATQTEDYLPGAISGVVIGCGPKSQNTT